MTCIYQCTDCEAQVEWNEKGECPHCGGYISGLSKDIEDQIEREWWELENE